MTDLPQRAGRSVVVAGPRARQAVFREALEDLGSRSREVLAEYR